MANWTDILSGKEEEINEEDLLKYLDENLPEAEKQRIEQKLSSSSFANDAVEGLQKFNDKKSLNVFVDQLNRNLHQQLNARKLKHEKRRIKDPWILIAIITVLSICIIGYVMIHMHRNS